MVLLDDVVEWDENRIVCVTLSHRRPDNPLRRDGILPAVAGCEYGAQAMAVHAGLLGLDGSGYLAGLRNVDLAAERLDDVAGQLEVSARMRLRSAAGVVYRFEVSDGSRALVSGQATVVLDDGNYDGTSDEQTV